MAQSLIIQMTRNYARQRKGGGREGGRRSGRSGTSIEWPPLPSSGQMGNRAPRWLAEKKRKFGTTRYKMETGGSDYIPLLSKTSDLNNNNNNNNNNNCNNKEKIILIPVHLGIKIATGTDYSARNNEQSRPIVCHQREEHKCKETP